ncbi:MAG: hypothetical protein HYZ58_04605 [Acidobacteria bacterium]|nr:hypothetical protein [Acidobacteriota bacterium]MBI3262415.1 hypothetical protein [Acidobacteriota bacterium]
MRMARPVALLILVLWCPACAGSGQQSQEAPAADSAAPANQLSIGERYQKANLEVTQLLIEADRRQIDAREFRSRHTGITLASVKNFESATYDMEKLAVDLKKALGK